MGAIKRLVNLQIQMSNTMYNRVIRTIADDEDRLYDAPRSSMAPTIHEKHSGGSISSHTSSNATRRTSLTTYASTRAYSTSSSMPLKISLSRPVEDILSSTLTANNCLSGTSLWRFGRTCSHLWSVQGCRLPVNSTGWSGDLVPQLPLAQGDLHHG